MFFLSGITGKVGGAAATRLLEQGHKLAALVRDPDSASARAWAARGVQLHRGDLGDARALAAAMAGAEGAFVMVPPSLTSGDDFADSRAILASLGAALDEAKPGKVVALSSYGSEKPSGLGLITATHLLEERLSALATPVALVRAGSFLDNYSDGVVRAADSGVLESFFAPVERPLPMIATADIGAQVAALLAQPWSGRRVVELGSYVSPAQVAAAMSEVTGKPIAARAVPRALWTQIIEGFGLPPGTTGPYEEMLDSINSGWIDFGAPGAERVAATLSPRQFFAQLRR